MNDGVCLVLLDKLLESVTISDIQLLEATGEAKSIVLHVCREHSFLANLLD